MAEASMESVLELSYQVQSVVPVSPPEGSSGSWFRYIITQGSNTENAITGVRSGNLAEINVQLAEMVDRLNERRGKLQAKKK